VSAAPVAEPAVVAVPAPARTGYRRRILTRLGHALIVLWGAVTFTFAALHLIRGSVVDAIIGNNLQVTPEIRAEVERRYGLGEPLWRQYLHQTGSLLRGDLGESYQLSMPVSQAIREQVGPTLTLMATAIALAGAVSLVLALATAGRSRWVKGPFAALEATAVSVPQFWLGILLLTVFSFGLRWFPVIGTGPGALVLPAVTLALPVAGVLTPVMREGVERALEEPFVVTARARGASEWIVLSRHVLRHALIPAVTLLGLLAGALTGGAVIVEQVFSRPGLGRLLVTAVTGKDIPVVLGTVLVTALFYVTVNLVVDLLYPLIDPRLRD